MDKQPKNEGNFLVTKNGFSIFTTDFEKTKFYIDPKVEEDQCDDNKSDRSDNIFGLVELLTDKDYKEIIFEHNGYKQSCYALKSASTDFDMTG